MKRRCGCFYRFSSSESNETMYTIQIFNNKRNFLKLCLLIKHVATIPLVALLLLDMRITDEEREAATREANRENSYTD